MSSLLFRVSPIDPLYILVTAYVVAAAAAASYFPACKATTVVPADALRLE